MDGTRAKAIVHAYFERLLNEKDLAVCDELLAPDFVDHDAPPDAAPGPASTKQYMTEFFAHHAEVRLEIADLIAEDGRVALRAVWQGVDDESRPYRQTGIVFVRAERGRAARRALVGVRAGRVSVTHELEDFGVERSQGDRSRALNTVG